jgi:anti-anti-sigma regulatory factor
VRLALAAAVDGGTGDLLLDVAALTGVDATGLGSSSGRTGTRDASAARWCCSTCPPPLARALRLTRLDRVLRRRRLRLSLQSARRQPICGG